MIEGANNLRKKSARKQLCLYTEQQKQSVNGTEAVKKTDRKSY